MDRMQADESDPWILAVAGPVGFLGPQRLIAGLVSREPRCAGCGYPVFVDEHQDFCGRPALRAMPSFPIRRARAVA